MCNYKNPVGRNESSAVREPRFSIASLRSMKRLLEKMVYGKYMFHGVISSLVYMILIFTG